MNIGQLEDWNIVTPKGRYMIRRLKDSYSE